jgi:LPS sulfotransferase NodH
MRAPLPFVVLASARTGSTHLMEVLNQHPNVVAQLELLNPNAPGWRGIDREAMPTSELLRLGYEQYPRRGSAVASVGCKIIDNQTQDHRSQVLDELAGWSQLRVIRLHRLNVFEAIRSRAQAKQSGQWQRWVGSASEPPPPRVRLERDECLVYIRNAEAFSRRVKELFPPERTLTLSYEELWLQAPQASLDAVWRFLEVEAYLPSTVLQRLESRPLSETVLNYAELHEWFADTPYGQCLT